MADGNRRSRWAHGLARLAFFLSIGGIGIALVAAIGTAVGAWPYGAGLGALRYALFAAVAGGVLAIVAWIVARKTDARTGTLNGLALVASLLFVGYLGNQIVTARSVPAIHDATTSLDDPPQFRALPVRADNLENIPDQGRPELAALSPEERWKALHREAYSDLRPLSVPVPPAQAIRVAEQLARERGWEIAEVNRDAGTLEATATTLFFRFKDDVAIRVRPDAARPAAAVVDMRSISRVGVSDVGVNAKRIRSFLEDLKAAAR